MTGPGIIPGGIPGIIPGCICMTPAHSRRHLHLPGTPGGSAFLEPAEHALINLRALILRQFPDILTDRWPAAGHDIIAKAQNFVGLRNGCVELAA